MFDFYDQRLTEEYHKNGYVVLELFTAAEIEFFKSVYQAKRHYHLVDQEVLHSTADTANFDLINSIHEQVYPIIEDKLKSIIRDFDTLVCGYLTKKPGEMSATSFHQDPTLVDEKIACSGNLWVPLQDVNENNGQLLVIPGSHRLGENNLRATPDCPLYYKDYRHRLKKYSEPIPLKAGQAVLLNHSMIHGSTSNLKEERVALVTAIKSDSSLPWDFYYKHPDDKHSQIEHYHITFESFAKLQKNERPVDSKLVDKINYEFTKVSWVEFLKFMKSEYQKASHWDIIKAYFTHDTRS